MCICRWGSCALTWTVRAFLTARYVWLFCASGSYEFDCRTQFQWYSAHNACSHASSSKRGTTHMIGLAPWLGSNQLVDRLIVYVALLVLSSELDPSNQKWTQSCRFWMWFFFSFLSRLPIVFQKFAFLRLLIIMQLQQFPPGITFGSKVAFYFDTAGAYLSMQFSGGKYPVQGTTISSDCIWSSYSKRGVLPGWATGQRDAYSSLQEAKQKCEQNSNCCGVTKEPRERGGTS